MTTENLTTPEESNVAVDSTNGAQAGSNEETQTATPSPSTIEPKGSEEPDPAVAKGSEQKPTDIQPVKKDGPFGKSDLEKATYSFHKQLAKQAAKFDKEKKELLDRLEKLEHPEKYRPKTRADFPNEAGGDDEYINYLVQQKVQSMFDAQIAAWKKEQEEQESRNAVDEEYRARAEENIKKLYPTPEAEKEFREVVRDAMDRGLGELLDKDEGLSNYILMSPVGPSIMYKLASSQETVQRLFEGARSPIDLQFRIRDIEREVKEEMDKKLASPSLATPTPAAKETTQPQLAAPKPVGKPGLTKEANKTIWDDDAALLKFMRS
jgi:hypothetical protein